MSRKPGIARQFYEDHKDDFYVDRLDHISVSTPHGGRQLRPPRYFDNLFDIEDHEMLQEIKANRREIVENLWKMRQEQSGKNYLELLSSMEENTKNRIKSLKRSEI